MTTLVAQLGDDLRGMFSWNDLSVVIESAVHDMSDDVLPSYLVDDGDEEESVELP